MGGRLSELPRLISMAWSRLGIVAIFLVSNVFLICSYNKSELFIAVASHKLWHIFRPPKAWERILRCSDSACSAQEPLSKHKQGASAANARQGPSASPCPAFFQWIHKDLTPWKLAGGVTRWNLEQASRNAALRVTIVDGKLYSELYRSCPQSRSIFTLWGLLMLLERLPGKIPDLDLMLNCVDRPAIQRKDYKKRIPPALFSYCTNRDNFDIPFPDWSYWGWPEVNIGTWEEESRDIFRSSNEIEWRDRKPAAYWKGNPQMGHLRKHLLKCNPSEKHDFGAQIDIQDWIRESHSGFKNSKLSKQCDHRYKIYAEGSTWSVSFKYILACGSTMLNVDPEYYDFLMRGLLPGFHYLPISRNPSNMCQSVQHAVRWGNSHSLEAEAIGKHGQDFLREMSMDRVYDYMFHLLQEYAKLQTFKPRVPPGAQLLCRNAMQCIGDQSQREFFNRTPPPPANMTHTPCLLAPD